MEELLQGMEWVEHVMEEKAKPTLQERINAIEGEINGLKALLANTDWCVIKCQETGRRISEAYPDESAARSEARRRINELEAGLIALHKALVAE